MKTQILVDELWPTITKLAKQSNHTHVAVAYLGRGARKLLPLHDDDTLVIDMSPETVKGGQTDPFEVEKYFKAGVNTYTCSNLHAKVYVFDSTVILSSANISQHSKRGLVEAGLLCKDRDVLADARGFVKSLQVEPVTPEYLRVCKRLYTPPRIKHRTGKSPLGKVTPTHSRLWMLGTHPVEFSEEEYRLCEEEEKKAARKLKNAQEFEVNSIRWTGKSALTRLATEGDLAVQVAHENGKIKVYPPCRILRITRYRSFDQGKRPRLLLQLEVPKRPHLLSWQYFSSRIRPCLKSIGKDPQRLVRSPEAAHRILGLWRTEAHA